MFLAKVIDLRAVIIHILEFLLVYVGVGLKGLYHVTKTFDMLSIMVNIS